MTEPGATRQAGSASRVLNGWLNRSVSWKVIIVTLAALGAAVALFVVAGGVSVSADKPDGWLATHLLHFVFKRSEATHSGEVTAPSDLFAPSRVRLAAQHFDMVCANCHGRPGFGQSVVALSMSPRPQYLPKVVGQFTNAELYEIVEHGVKYSAMPSWPTDARGDEVWSMVAFLRQLPKMDAKTYLAMTAPPTKPAPVSTDAAGNPTLRPANALRNAPPTDEFAYAAPSSGFSDPTIHDNPAITCARCHGADGSGAATGGEAPNLTVQDAAYLRATLEAYISGARKSGYMQNIAAQLSGPQVAALAGYYAGLPVQTESAGTTNPALVQRGAAIAAQGIRQFAIPACSTCHESQGVQITSAPHIAGQSDTYLRRALHAMARGGRGSSVIWNPMPAVAHDLSDNDIAALAAYYSGLKPARAQGAVTLASWPTAATDVKIDLVTAKKIFQTQCLNCHVNGGRGDLEGNFPNLTVLTQPYAAQSLYAFRARTRLNNKMQEVTDALTLDQMTSLAAYVNGLSPQRALVKVDAAAAARGALIATKGAPDRGVPACLGCHGAKGVAMLPLIPPLQGQSVAYLHRKLDNFARPNGANVSALNPMPGIASPLTAEERADLAAYFAAAAPLPKAAVRP